MSFLSYNGVELKPVRTRRFSQIPVFSDDGSEYLHTLYTISVSAVYNPAQTSYVGGNPPMQVAGGSPADTDAAIRGHLAQPRRPLYYTDGENVIVHSPADGHAVDAVNGPHPKIVNVREIVGSKTWMVDFEVETAINECIIVEGKPVVANRWSRRHSVDEQAMTTVFTSGVAVFRMDALELEASKNADHFRNEVIPGPPPNFRRMSLEVTVNPTGNILQYSVVDREQFYLLGDAATSKHPDVLSFDGTYSQSTIPAPGSSMPGALIAGAVNISVHGRKSSLRQNLIVFAVNIAIEKLAIAEGRQADPLVNGVVTRLQISEKLDGRTINLLAEALFSAGKRGKAGTAGLRTEFFYNNGILEVFDQNGGCPQLPNDQNTRGTYTGELFATALRSQCEIVQTERSNSAKQGSSDGNVLNEPYSFGISVGQFPTEIENRIQDPEDSGIFTDYRIESNWSKSMNTLMAPVSGTPGSTHSSSSGSESESSGQCEFMIVAKPSSIRTISWTAERWGSPPSIPTPDLHGDNYVLLHSEISPCSPIPAADLQTPVYRVGGVYRFGCKKPVGAGDKIPLCLAPWIDSSFDEQSIKEENYRHGIIDSAEESSGEDKGGESDDETIGPVH